MLRRRTCLDWFPSQDEEGFRSLGEESGEFVDKNLLNLVCLLDFNADADAVDAWLNEDFLVVIPGHCQWIQ